MRRTAMPSHVGTHGFVLMVNKGATVAIRRFINAKYLLHVTLRSCRQRLLWPSRCMFPAMVKKSPAAGAMSRQ
ncbi:protein of unknown function [Hyphomicrobium sp. 1Nfss2.1]